MITDGQQDTDMRQAQLAPKCQAVLDKWGNACTMSCTTGPGQTHARHPIGDSFHDGVSDALA
jgi:hypothetical protein